MPDWLKMAPDNLIVAALRTVARYRPVWSGLLREAAARIEEAREERRLLRKDLDNLRAALAEFKD